MRAPAEPPRWRFDPAVSVVPGEVLDEEADAAVLLGMTPKQLRTLRLAGQSPLPFILTGSVAFYPRRNGRQPAPRPASPGLANARRELRMAEAHRAGRL